MKYYVGNQPPFKPSIFPLHFREFTDTNIAGKEIIVPNGTDVPSILKLYYAVADVTPITAPFPFLSRDSTTKHYQIASTDPFVFKDLASIAGFSRHGHRLIAMLTHLGETLGIQSTYDNERQVKVIAPEATNTFLESASSVTERNIAGYILSNTDIGMKLSVNRAIPFGWAIVSYAGKISKSPKTLAPAVKVILAAFTELIKTPEYQNKLSKVLKESADPLISGVGYPLFSAELTTEGVPVSKIRIIRKYKGLYNDFIKCKDRAEFEACLVKRAGNSPVAQWGYAIAPIRRTSAGYKWQHRFVQTPAGLVSSGDMRGFPSTRVAWMPPYFLNLLLSVLQSRMKAVRMLIPGAYHDGPTRLENLNSLREKRRLTHESDYKNYDRTIPYDITLQLIHGMIDILGLHPNYKFLADMLVKDVPIIFPDHIDTGDSRSSLGSGYVVKAPSLGLLSGLKYTSELGTFTNLVALIAGALSTGMLTETTAKQYLLDKLHRNRKDPWWFIQSDDVLLSGADEKELAVLVKSFEIGADAAGFKYEHYPGDKFLMRHLFLGRDLPVAMRVYQNTISNEEPTRDVLTFRVGLGIRSDGLLGFKSFDPFKTGLLYPIPIAQAFFETAVLEAIKFSIATSAAPDKDTLNFLELLIAYGKTLTALKTIESKTDLVGMTSTSLSSAQKQLITQIGTARMRFLEELAIAETEKLKQGATSDSGLVQLANYVRNVHSPAALLTLIGIESSLSMEGKLELAKALNREHAFYVYACKTLGIPDSLLTSGQ